MRMLIDGKETTSVAADDRGLQYGDGLFETIAVVHGSPRLWRHHMARLQEGCVRLGIRFPAADTLYAEAQRLCSTTERAVVKIIITRGSGGRGYRPLVDAQPRRIVSSHPWPEFAADRATSGVEVRVCDTRLGINPALAGIKHLNRLEQVLARSEWDDPAIAEGIMLDSDNCLVEGTMSNLFIVRDGWLLTPALERCGVAGVMRTHILELAEQLGMNCEIKRLQLNDLQQGEEAFLCNSIIGIWPIRRFGHREYPLGATTGRLMQAVALAEG